MKPSNFTLNSDYLSIAQVDNHEYTAYFGGGTLVAGGHTEQNADFATTAQNGAIDRILISKDGGDYMLGSYMQLTISWDEGYTNNIVGFLHVFRPNSTTIRAQLVLDNYSSGSASYPALSFKIKASSFRPPNVF